MSTPTTDPESENASFSAQFWVNFNEMQAVITSSLDDTAITSEKIAQAKSSTSELQRFVTGAAIDLPKYDLRRSQEEVEKLKKRVSSMETALQPKKKFSFSSRSKNKEKKTTSTSGHSAQENKQSKTAAEQITVQSTPAAGNVARSTGTSVTTEVAKVPATSTAFTAKSICVEDRNNEERIDISSEVEKDAGYQVYIKNCDNSTVSVRATIGSARLENLTGCKVLLGPCCTSIYVENCTSCTFFIRCHQLRIHHAYSSSFYVLVNSHPIIEDCSALGFAPYHASYPTLSRDLEAANLLAATNWDNVVDFRWHRSTTSPNWSVIPPEERMSSLGAAGWTLEEPIACCSGGGECTGGDGVDDDDDEEEL